MMTLRYDRLHIQAYLTQTDSFEKANYDNAASSDILYFCQRCPPISFDWPQRQRNHKRKSFHLARHRLWATGQALRHRASTAI